MLNQRGKQNQGAVFDNKFYDSRYAKGYMEHWPVDKITREFEVINS